MSSHSARATGSETRAFRKSAGTVCTAPCDMPFLAMNFILPRPTAPYSARPAARVTGDEQMSLISSVLISVEGPLPTVRVLLTIGKQ